jgi:phosphorylase superfamily protein
MRPYGKRSIVACRLQHGLTAIARVGQFLTERSNQAAVFGLYCVVDSTLAGNTFVSELSRPGMTLLVTVNEAEKDQTNAPGKAVIAVVGLAIEARIAGTAAIIADGDRTAFLLRDAIRQGVSGIISFGVCGGLDPELRPGKVIVASSVLAGKGEAYPSDLLWAEELRRTIPDAGHSPMAGVGFPDGKF